jgi:threonylcarbamoyladenosine tRNA methylthiotransferase MtaB
MVDRFGDRVRQFLTAIAPTPRATQALRVLGQPPMRGQRQHSGHVRAELKIQDGCDAHCTFCIIPTLRPVLRSKPVAEVVQEARMLVDAGHIELVLTGIFIGAFGHETALRRKQTNRFASPLADLLDAVAQVPGLERLRLSSMEPGDVDTPLLDVMVSHASTIVPHLHLPLQSGSDAILRRMNRQYTTGDYRDMLGAVNAALTTSDGLGPALTTDVICGFPGETPEDAQATVDLALEASFLHMHVFPYSPRPGTAAARWTTQAVPSTIARERVRRLIRLETGPNGLRQAFQKHLLGRELRVILESPDAARPGRWLGRCDHYAQLSVQCDESRLSPRSGQMVRAIPTTIDDDVLLATRVQASVALPVLVPQ